MNREKIAEGFWCRLLWLIACGLFPFIDWAIYMVLFEHSKDPQFWKLDGMRVVNVCIGVRLLVGLALGEKAWKVWFYFFLPIPFAVAIGWSGELVRHPPRWLDI